MRKATLLMATPLAAATVIVAGLAVVPSITQNAQANLCSNITIATSAEEAASEAAAEDDSGDADIDQDINLKCKFFDDVDVDETS
jgi:uncharacterized membrane protein YdfJ with MMPL/SSD domain